MLKLQRLSEKGSAAFRIWLRELGHNGSGDPAHLLQGNFIDDVPYDIEIDETKTFEYAYEIADYLNAQFQGAQLDQLMARDHDGIWEWLAIVYFRQIAPRRKAPERYIVDRSTGRSPLAYRNMLRSWFELVRVHGPHARFCLNSSVSEWSDMAEQLTARQGLARHEEFFSLASRLYLDSDLKTKRGAASVPTNRKKRQPRSRKGYGGLRRLITVLQRIDLTYDSAVMKMEELYQVIPTEFKKTFGNDIDSTSDAMNA